MKSRRELTPRFKHVGESGLLIELGENLSLELNQVIWSLNSRLRQEPLEGVESWVPAYASLLVIFDPMALTNGEVQNGY